MAHTGIQEHVHTSTRARSNVVWVQAETSCVYRRLLDLLGYTIATTIALPHRKTAVVALSSAWPIRTL